MIDDLYQKNAHFSKLKLFFSMRCIRLSTVVLELWRFVDLLDSSGEMLDFRSSQETALDVPCVFKGGSAGDTK